MEQMTINKNYLLLQKWWDSIDLSNYEKSFFSKEIISFNQQLYRLKEKKMRIGIYGKSGVGKSYILNFLLNKNVFKTDIINGSTKEIIREEWIVKDQRIKTIKIFLPSLINELISFTSFLFISPATTNKIISE